MPECSKCGEEKVGTEFYPEPRKKNGLMSKCKVCSSADCADYYHRNREKVDQKNREWKAGNVERVRKYQRDRHRHQMEYNEAYRTHYLAYQRGLSKQQWEEIKSDPERLAEYRESAVKRTMKWQKENPEKYRAHQILRKAIINGEIEKGIICEDCGYEDLVEDDLVGHHEDYTKPLEVIWLCGPCHRVRHREYE